MLACSPRRGGVRKHYDPLGENEEEQNVYGRLDLQVCGAERFVFVEDCIRKGPD